MRYLIALPLLLAAVSVQAEPQVDAAPAGTVIRLTAEQIAALEAALIKRGDSVVTVVDETAPTEAVPVPDRRPHGEVGFGIGTGGYSALFGTVVTPLGDDGFAAFSFYQQRDGRRKRSRR